MFSSVKIGVFRHIGYVEPNYLGGCCVIPVRWRKLRHKPRAPSKFFVVREPTIAPDWEVDFLKEKYPFYKTQIKAIMKLFKDQYEQKGVGSQDDQERIKHLEEEHEAMMKINTQWNSEVARNREIRIAMATLEHRWSATKAIERKTQISLQQLEKAEEEIQKTKEQSKEFITMDNIDSKLEELLDSRVNFNFAIDKEGNKFYQENSVSRTSDGRTKPVEKAVHSS